MSVGWVHIQTGQLLTVRSRGRDKYFLPGGKPEPGETLEQALRREVREELGVTLHNLTQAFTVTAPAYAQDVPTELTMHCFSADASGDLTPQGEIEKLAWLNDPSDPQAAPAVTVVLNRIAQANAAGP